MLVINKSYINVLLSLLLDSEKIECIEYFVDFFSIVLKLKSVGCFQIQNLSKRPERVIIDARQLKICATCFDFVVSLLRVLEMICTICLQVFTDSTRDNTENLLERLCQVSHLHHLLPTRLSWLLIHRDETFLLVVGELSFFILPPAVPRG